MKEIMNEEQIKRTLKRIAHEIIEQNNDLNQIVLMGILQKGLPIAKRLQANLKLFANIDVPLVGIDISPFRDDKKSDKIIEKLNLDLNNKTIILVDDVLFTGRSVRAAMDAINYHGRPSKIELAILIDRGHRELPIRADYIGKNIPTSKDEKIFVDPKSFTVYIVKTT